MPKFRVEAQTHLGQAEAFEKMKQLISADADLKKLDSNLKVETNDKSHTAILKGSKFSAEVSVAPQGGGSQVAIAVDLPLLLMPAKSMIQSTLEKKLAKLFA